MSKFDDLTRRLRVRVKLSANRERSLDWKAADAIDQLRARNDSLEAENKRLDAENRFLREKNRAPAVDAENRDDPQQIAPAEHCVEIRERPMTPPLCAHALSLKEAADLLNVSYSTVFAHKHEIGFFQIGNQWRAWPETFREMTSVKAGAEPLMGAPSGSRRSEEKAYTIPLSALEASKKLDERLARKPRKSRSTKL
jgi:excisionase family DNA binding protein